MPHPNDAVVSAIEFLADLTVTHTEMGAGKAKVNLGKLISSYCNVHSISIHARYGDDFKSAPLYALITKKSFPMLYDKYHTSLASVDKKVLHVLKNAKSGQKDTRTQKYLIAYQEKQKCLPAMQEEVRLPRSLHLSCTLLSILQTLTLSPAHFVVPTHIYVSYAHSHTCCMVFFSHIISCLCRSRVFQQQLRSSPISQLYCRWVANPCLTICGQAALAFGLTQQFILHSRLHLVLLQAKWLRLNSKL